MNAEEKVYPIGVRPAFDDIPEKMYAWTLRTETLGEPIKAYHNEIVDIPEIGDDELLIYNIACGLNYNGVWAALGKPKNVIKTHQKYEKKQDFLICGCESSGIVYKVGKNVKNFKVGDEVLCIGIQYDKNCEVLKETKDPRLSPTFRIWGYEGNFGAFAQYSKVLEVQCVHKPKELSWEAAAGCSATGGTVYNMLTHWKGNELKEGDIVLVWGGAGGLGSSAIPLIKEMGGIPIAVVSSDKRGEWCMELGAKGYINRTGYDHWGILSDDLFNDENAYKKWLKNNIKIRKEIWKIAGKKEDPKIVLEHPGRDTLPSSIFLCSKKGMVVLCGATTGYLGSLDLRYLWLGIRRLQGSHAGLNSDVENYLNIIKRDGYPLPELEIYGFEDIPMCLQNMYENKRFKGNLVALIGSAKSD
jgi:crotonyl-CoA carboxylase/reductase